MFDLSKPDTPLTPEQRRKKQQRTMWLLSGLLWGTIVLLDGREWADALLLKSAILGLPWPVVVLIWVVCFPFLYWLTVAVHEGGHVAGALVAHFRVLSFAAMHLHVSRKAQGWKVQLKKPTARLAGMIQAFPTHDRHLRVRYAVMIAGGPLANILTGVVALYLWYRLPSTAYTSSVNAYVLSNALCIFGWLSVLMGGLNVVPRTLPSGHIIDGQTLWNLLQGGPAMHQHIGLLYFQSLTYAGVPPRDWNRKRLEAFLTHKSDTVLDFYAHIYAFGYYQDCNEPEEAQLHLDKALYLRKTSPVLMQQYVLAEAACIAALHIRDREQACAWLQLAQEVKPFTEEDTLFPRAAVAYIEGQLAEAQVLLQAARNQLQEAVSTGGNAQAFERMDDLYDLIQQARLQQA